MFKKYLLPIAVVLLIVPTFIEPAGAIPLTSLGLGTAAPPSGAQPVYYYRGRGYYRGATLAARTATAAAITAVTGTGRDDVGTAVAGGPMVSAVAGGRLPSATYGYVVEDRISENVAVSLFP